MARQRRIIGWLVAGAGAAVLLAACSSTPSSTTTTTSAATTTTSVTPTTAAPSSSTAVTASSTPTGGSTTTLPPFFTKAGKGNAASVSVTTPSGKQWHLQWHFDCGTKKGKFALSIQASAAKSPTKVSTQDGLGGGGNRDYPAGTYALKITTACGWTLKGFEV